MADDKEIIFKVGLDSSDIDSGVQDAKKKLASIGDTPMDKSVQTLKQALKEANFEAQRIANSQGVNNEKFREAAKRVAELKDQFGEYNDTIKSFNPDNKLQGLVSVAKGATGALQGVSGGMAFLGVESGKASETMAKLQGLMAFSAALNSVDDLKNGFKNLSLVMGLTKTSTEGASVATTGFGTAFKAIGIGLLISALAYVVANFDEIKTAVLKVVPSLANLGEMFDKLKEIVWGVGNAVIQYVQAPVKALVSLIQGDFKGAIADVKKGMDVVGNYQDAANKKRLDNEKDIAREIAKNRVEENEKRIKHLQEEGQDTYALELANNQIKKGLYDKETKEYKEVLDERETLASKHTKKMNEAAEKEAAKADAAAKAAAAKAAARKKAIDEAEMKAQLEIDKLHEENTVTVIENVNQAKRQKIEADYHIELQQVLANTKITEETRTQLLMEYRKKRANAINALEVSIAAETAKREADLAAGLAKALADRAKVGGVKIDNPDAGALTEEQMKARFDLTRKLLLSENQIKRDDLKTQYDAEYKLLGGNVDAQLKLKKWYTDSSKKLDNDELNSKLSVVQNVGSAVSALGNLFAKQTVANKALNAANALMNTYVGITEIWRAKSLIPEPFGTAAKVASTVIAATSGFAAVKNIFKVDTTGGSGGGSAAGASAPSVASAPTISAMGAASANPIPQDVRVTNPQNQIVQAYISDRDLKNNEDRTNFLNKMKTI